MRKIFNSPHSLLLGILLFAVFGLLAPKLIAQDAATAISKEKIEALDKELSEAKAASSEARQRIDVRRVIRTAEDLVAAHANDTSRFLALEFLFRAYQRLIALDKDVENRKALLAICHELVKAPNEYAASRFEAELILSQSELVSKGADTRERGQALMSLVERYRDTDIETNAIKVAIAMALELGDSLVIGDLMNLISERYSGNLDMLAYQREKLGGQVLGAWFTGIFERSDGKLMRFPMDVMGKSTILCFWSKEGDAIKRLEALAAAVNELQAEGYGRTMIVSFNVDGLPDAGASILAGIGVNWPALKLPGGRENPYYKIYAKRDPAFVDLSVTAQAALLMAGSTKNSNPGKNEVPAKPNYNRLVSSSLNKQWASLRYTSQLVSILNGEFLVTDPEGPLNPSRPPEIKALASVAQQLTRTEASVPEATLNAIQDCFVMSPIRFRTPNTLLKANFEKAEALCAKAIQDHPQAPDLWIVRNRRIIALMALWKLEGDLAIFNRAAVEAKSLIDSKPPVGTDVVARFCLAREALRSSEVKPKQVVADFLSALGGEKAPGPALAVAAILALEIGDRMLHEKLRRTILDRHADEPMMWQIVSYMLNRNNRYWLYQVPFEAGWSYANRYDYSINKGNPEDCKRTVTAEFKKLDGGLFQIPKDTAGKLTVIYFRSIGNQDPAIIQQKLVSDTLRFNNFKKDLGDVQFICAILDNDAQKASELLKPLPGGVPPITCPVMIVPNGLKNPIVQKLGIASEDEFFNMLILRPDGSIAAMRTDEADNIQKIAWVFDWYQGNLVKEALETGDIEKAKQLAFQFMPPVLDNPENKKIQHTPFDLEQLHARARVYFAIKEYNKALADAKEVLNSQRGIDSGMSLRSKELGIIEKLVEEIRKFVPKKEVE